MSAKILVNTIQHGKKQFIEKYMDNHELKWTWNDYVDTQTKFVNQAIKTFTTTFEILHEKNMGLIPKQFTNPYNIDWYEAWWDSYVKNDLEKK